MSALPTRTPVELEVRPRHQHWLVDTLWGREAVGIIGGEPKCGKSFLALDLAVSVASGVACLRRFETDQPGPVVMFAAEDAGHIVRTRLEGIARAAGADFATLDIAVIDVPVLRLDHRIDRQRLHETIERIRPRLLVLDPLVRLHGVDENAVADIAPILAFLRDLQRRFSTAVVLVHHARKSGATRPGQALRGSSELHAWGDSNLYLRRRGQPNRHDRRASRRARPQRRRDRACRRRSGARSAPAPHGARRGRAEVAHPRTAHRLSARRGREATLAGPDPQTRRGSKRHRQRHPAQAPPAGAGRTRAQSLLPPRPQCGAQHHRAAGAARRRRPAGRRSPKCSRPNAWELEGTGTGTDDAHRGPGIVGETYVKRSARGRKLAYGHGSTRSRGRRRVTRSGRSEAKEPRSGLTRRRPRGIRSGVAPLNDRVPITIE